MDSNVDSTEPVLDENVKRLHERLVELLGGPPPSADLIDPYWDLDSNEFHEFFDEVIKESLPSTTASGNRSRATRGEKPNAQGKATDQPPTGS